MLSAALALAANVITATIDPLAWTQASSIAWPGSERAVTVMDANESWQPPGCEIGLEASDSASIDTYSFHMGEYCGSLVVVMNLSGGIRGGHEARMFLAQHESFHVAAQMYGSLIPVRFLEIYQRIVSRYAEGSQFTDLYSHIDSFTKRITQVGSSGSGCAALEKSLDSLDEDARTYLDYKIFWEWPAEYYAQQVIFPHDYEKYVEVRRNVFASGGDSGSDLFMTGVRVGRALDVLVGRVNWQLRVSEGWTMLDLLLESSGCEARAPGPTVRMKRVEL